MHALRENALTRRSMARLTGVLAAAGSLAAITEPMIAQEAARDNATKRGVIRIPLGAVKLNANENPLGPCPEAVAAASGVIAASGRYLYEHAFELTVALSERENIAPDYIQPFAGSSDALHRIVLAYTNPARSLVVANPGYEAAVRATRLSGARVMSVSLTPGYAHDVKAMAAADPSAGVIYVCNPNNPTGTLTPRADIEWLLNNKPAGSVLLLDEAYLHYTEAPGCIDLVGKGKDIVVLRSFSKLYGLAGLRAGVAFGRPDLLARIRLYAAGSLPAPGMAAATASLRTRHLAAARRKAMNDLRGDLFSFLTAHNIGFIPSESSFFMLDSQRPGEDFVAAMAVRNVFVGRVWPIMPNHSRISIGTADEMDKFKQAVLKVMA